MLISNRNVLLRVLEVQVQPASLVDLVRTSFSWQTADFSLYPYMSESREKQVLFDSLKDANLIHEGLSSGPHLIRITSQRPRPNTTISGGRISRILGKILTFSLLRR